jgi:hypothetical protein
MVLHPHVCKELGLILSARCRAKQIGTCPTIIAWRPLPVYNLAPSGYWIWAASLHPPLAVPGSHVISCRIQTRLCRLSRGIESEGDLPLSSEFIETFYTLTSHITCRSCHQCPSELRRWDEHLYVPFLQEHALMMSPNPTAPQPTSSQASLTRQQVAVHSRVYSLSSLVSDGEPEGVYLQNDLTNALDGYPSRSMGCRKSFITVAGLRSRHVCIWTHGQSEEAPCSRCPSIHASSLPIGMCLNCPV